MRNDPRTAMLILVLSSLCLAQAGNAPATDQAPAQSSSSIKAPHPDRGVYAIWYQGGRDHLLDLPFIRGGQVFAQWAEIEPVEGEYHWEKIDAQLKRLHDQGLKCTVQINANLKPEWMFTRIPYWPKALPQVENRQGTPMYWHPEFIKAYQRFIAAQAAHLKASPYRGTILGMRMNFSGIGNEPLNASATGTDLTKWVVPPGVSRDGLRPWTPEITTDYQKTVMAEYVRNFLPEIFVFVRTHTELAAREDFLTYFDRGRMGWFHTGAQPVEPPDEWWQRVYRTFADYGRTGKTLGYAEPISDAMGHRGRHTPAAERADYGAQTNYWRTLVDLQYGIDFIAYYANDLQIAADGTSAYGDFKGLQGEYRAAMEFAAKYAGYLGCPEVSPGAWVGLRQLEPKAKAEKLSITNDCEFLIRRLPDHSRGAVKVGPAEQRFGGWARVLPKGEPMRFALDGRFAASLADRPATLKIIYFDEHPGATVAVAASGELFDIAMKGTKRWQTASFELPRCRFMPDAAGAAITVHCAQQDITLHMVEVTRGAAAP